MGKQEVKIVAVIQARMGSTRFPGKVLADLAGRPVIWHIVHRLRKSEYLDDVVIATSTNSSDDELVNYAEKNSIQCIRGPEDNVLERYKIAQDQVQADIIVRITGDVPLVDYNLVDQLVSKMVQDGGDFITLPSGTKTVHEGIDPFSSAALEKLWMIAREDNTAREHVTGYIKNHPDEFKISYLVLDSYPYVPGARFSVDTPADLQFFRKIYELLDVPPGEAEIERAVELLKRFPELIDINSHVYQKQINDITRKVLIRCDGGSQIGLGHIYRCSALAGAFREKHGWGVTFAMTMDEAGFSIIRDQGYKLLVNTDSFDEEKWLELIVSDVNPDVLVLDIKKDISRECLEGIKKRKIFIINIDDESNKRLYADMNVYPPVPQVQKLDWDGYNGVVLHDWKHILIRKEFAAIVRTKKNSAKPSILVTMGGSDPYGLVFRVVDSLARLDEEFRVIFLIGAAFERMNELEKRLSRTDLDYNIHINPDNVAELMMQADFAIASFGTVAFELVRCEIPAIYLCISEDHSKTANFFQRSGFGVNLGLFTDVNDEQILEVVSGFIKIECIKDYRDNLRGVIDGKGAERVVMAIKSIAYEI